MAEDLGCGLEQRGLYEQDGHFFYCYGGNGRDDNHDVCIVTFRRGGADNTP